MATLSNPVYYNGGADAGDSRLVGVVSGLNRVVRYTLTLDADEYATDIAIAMDSGGYTSWGNYDSEGWKDEYVNDELSLYFHIGTDPDEFVNAGANQVSEATGKVTMVRRSGSGVSEDIAWNMTLEGKAMLLPGVTYYLWIYPGWVNGSIWGYFRWYDNGAGRFKYTVELSGSPGLVYIDNGSGLDAYQCYIDNGSGWDLHIPYIDNGSGWDMCS